jgi:hypothetical protein
VKVVLAPAFREEIGHGETFEFGYCPYEVDVFFEIYAVFGLVPFFRQIAVEAVAFARGAKDDSRVGVDGEYSVDEFAVFCRKGAVVGIIDIILKRPGGYAFSPVVDAVLDCIIVGIYDF